MVSLFEHGLKRVHSTPRLVRLQHTAHSRSQRDATEGKERCFSKHPRSTFSAVIVLCRREDLQHVRGGGRKLSRHDSSLYGRGIRSAPHESQGEQLVIGVGGGNRSAWKFDRAGTTYLYLCDGLVDRFIERLVEQ